MRQTPPASLFLAARSRPPVCRCRGLRSCWWRRPAKPPGEAAVRWEAASSCRSLRRGAPIFHQTLLLPRASAGAAQTATAQCGLASPEANVLPPPSSGGATPARTCWQSPRAPKLVHVRAHGSSRPRIDHRERAKSGRLLRQDSSAPPGEAGVRRGNDGVETVCSLRRHSSSRQSFRPRSRSITVSSTGRVLQRVHRPSPPNHESAPRFVGDRPFAASRVLYGSWRPACPQLRLLRTKRGSPRQPGIDTSKWSTTNSTYGLASKSSQASANCGDQAQTLAYHDRGQRRIRCCLTTGAT